jgi:NAD(P)-dependent dehydrogenase (short-subunit alcohol dehydrogenase family)
MPDHGHTVAAMRRALITGAGRGIGRAIALRLAEDGHALAVSARSADELELVSSAARHNGTTLACALVADLADGEAAARLAGEAAEALAGPIEIFVHAAGIASIAALGDLDPADWDRTFAVNVGSAFRIAQAITGPMLQARWGRIVTIASLRARVGVPTTAAYTASKHALLGLTRVIAAELAPHGATANAVVPGWVDTKMVRDEITVLAEQLEVPEREAQRRLLREQRIGRFLEPAEVASLVAYLCGEDAAGITGQAIHIDGGSFQA